YSADSCAMSAQYAFAIAPYELMPLEILHGALVLLRGRARFEGAEIAALAGFRIDLAGIEPVLARWQFADHGTRALFSETPRVNRDCRSLVPRLFSGLQRHHERDDLVDLIVRKPRIRHRRRRAEVAVVRAEKFPQRRFRQARPLRQHRETGSGWRQNRKFVALLRHHMTC